MQPSHGLPSRLGLQEACDLTDSAHVGDFGGQDHAVCLSSNVEAVTKILEDGTDKH